MSREEQTNSKLSQNSRAAISYLLLWITGLIVLLTEKKSKFVKFHASQSLLTFLSLSIFFWISQALDIQLLMFLVVGFATLIWLVLLVTTFQGKKIKIPVIGEIAEDLSR